MEDNVKLHEYSSDFSELLRLTADKFNILQIFIEKDYWLTRALRRMAQNPNADKVVFKGGTALSKAFRLTNRFSEDVDIAVIDADSMTGNQLKMLIKRLAKDMASDLEEEVVKGITSKGSRFYKAIYKYPSIASLAAQSIVKQGQLFIEINTYGNPYPYVKKEILSFIGDYLTSINRQDLLELYDLKPFAINVLDKRRTIIEKLISLLRFSFSTGGGYDSSYSRGYKHYEPLAALESKIRHFYDLYYLSNDKECADYIKSSAFYGDLQELFTHDQTEFDEPTGWKDKTINDSPLIHDFPALWKELKTTYQTDLKPLAFIEIPDEKEVENTFNELINRIAERSYSDMSVSELNKRAVEYAKSTT